DFVIPAFASQIVAIERGIQEPIIKVGNLSMRRDFLDVMDVVDAYMKIIQRFDDLPNGAIFNIASGNAVAVENLLNTLLAFSSKKIDVVSDPARMRENDTPVMAGDAQALRRAVDWVPHRGMPDTLKSVLAY